MNQIFKKKKKTKYLHDYILGSKIEMMIAVL